MLLANATVGVGVLYPLLALVRESGTRNANTMEELLDRTFQWKSLGYLVWLAGCFILTTMFFIHEAYALGSAVLFVTNTSFWFLAFAWFKPAEDEEYRLLS